MRGPLTESDCSSYIWFRGGDLNGLRYIKPFMKSMGWACPGTPRVNSLSVSVIECILS